LAIGCHSISNGINGLIFGILGAATGIGLLMLPYVLGGMGAGDVKLMGTVGSFLGAKATFEAFLLIALAGGVYSLALILIRRDVFRGFFSEKMMVLSCMVMLREYVPIQAQSENSGQKLRLKYGVAIAFGTITYMLLKSLGIKFLM
jgi:prepilin peptidase CpaA